MRAQEKGAEMKRYEVLISDNASGDMDEIYTYIAETLLEPVIAAKQYDKIADAILSLEEMPELSGLREFYTVHQTSGKGYPRNCNKVKFNQDSLSQLH